MGERDLKDWQRSVAAEGEIYEVGGSLRDKLMRAERPVTDRDFLVRLIPVDHLIEILEQFGKVDKVGSSFGVLKFRPSNCVHVYDIALPRLEKSTGVGHRDFEVDFDPQVSVEDDLVRRDFTVNAIARNLVTDDLIDPCGGVEDIETGTLRATFDETFEEDPLRMVRAAQFAARFGFGIDKSTFTLMEKSAGLVGTVSPERIQEELVKLLTLAEKPSIGFMIMQDTGVLENILPELSRCNDFEQNEFHTYDLFLHTLYACDAAPKENLKVRLAALFHDLGKYETRESVECEGDQKTVFYGHQEVSANLTQSIMKRLRFSERLTSDVRLLVKHHMYNYTGDWSDAAVRRFIKRVGTGNLEDMFLLRQADLKANPRAPYDSSLDGELLSRVESELLRKVPLNIGDLEVGGKDVMQALGIGESPQVGEALNHLLEIVLENPEMNERSILLQELRSWARNLK